MFKEYCSSFLVKPDLGNKIFFQDHEHTYTYNDLIKSSLCRAHFFHNSPDHFFALKIESPYKLFSHLIGAILAQKNVLIISHKEPAQSINQYQESIPFTQILTDNDLEIPLNDFQFPEKHINNSHPAFFILSSGSSGPSKGIPLSLENVFHSAGSFIEFFKMTPEMVSFSNLPHHHIGGLMIFWRAFFSQSAVTINPDAHYDFISLVPLQLQRILHSKNPEQIKKLQDCLGVLIGGAPLNEDLKAWAAKTNIKIFETYGMSETCSMVMLNGKPLNGQLIELDPGGHFMIKGPTLTSSVPVDDNGFYHTKDIGVKNADGTFSFKHRADLLFKSGGELVNPLELEAKAKELPWISDAVVVPVKHSEWTQAAVMIYKAQEDSFNETHIKDHLKTFFHPHLVPRLFVKAPENLIKEGMKPKRFEIAAFAQEHYFKSLFHYLYIPNASAKKLMVYFHGFMEDHTDMIPLMDNHHETSFLFIDLPGHGKTKAQNFKSRAAVFSELQSLITHYQKSLPLSIYGYSMGGRVALELILMGIKADIFFLESGHFGLMTEEEKTSRLNADRKLFEKHLTLKEFFTEWYQNPIFASYNQSAHYEAEVKKKLDHDPKEWQASLEFFSPGLFPFSRQDVLHKLKTQKIVGITGVDDKKYSAHFEEIRKDLPLLSINEIEHCGHNPHKTHLGEVKKILLMSL